MRVFEGKKAARRDGAVVSSMPIPDTPAPEPTPDERREKVAALEETLSHMKPGDPCFTMFTDDRDEHLAALGGDPELRKGA